MNKKLALLFLDDSLQAAVQPFEGKFALLRKGGYPLYFVSYNGDTSFGDYREASWEENSGILGDFYNAVLAGKTFLESEFEKPYIELLNPILDDIKEKYDQRLAALTNTPLPKRAKIPVSLCFLESIPQKARAMIIGYLTDYGFKADNDEGFSLAEYLAWLKLHESVFSPLNYYGVVEALGPDLILSIIHIDSESQVSVIADVLYKGYGADTRIGALAKFALDEVNASYHVLSGEAFQKEYKAQLANARKWNSRLIHAHLPYITEKVKLFTKAGVSRSITFEKSKIDRSAGNRSRRVGMLFSRLVREQEVDLKKVIIFGDNLNNEQVIDGFRQFGEENILQLGSSHLTNLLHCMLLDLAGKASSIATLRIVESESLSPGSKVIMKWGTPTREVIASYEGDNKYRIEESKNAQVVKGDHFVAAKFELNRRVVLNNVFRTAQNKSLGHYRSSQPLSFLGMKK